MNISYDVRVDALYIKLIPGHHQLETRQVDDDINLDFDESNRLVGIEVLDASISQSTRFDFPTRAIP